MPVVSVTDNFDALFTTTLRNSKSELQDAASNSNAFFFKLKKSGSWKEISSLGFQAQIPLMYELSEPQPYGMYDELDTTPTDGITAALFDWRQTSLPVTIAGEEEAKNRGENGLINLLESKIKQTKLGIQQGFNRQFLQGNGPNAATAIQTPFTNVASGRVFIEPLPKLIAYDPSASLSVGSIAQNTYTWWRNQRHTGAAASYAAFLKDLRRLNADCSEGPGGEPDLHVTDKLVALFYEAALANQHRNTSYSSADLPFASVMFYGNPVVWDSYVPDAKNGTIASIPVSNSGTWYMINTKFFEVQVQKDANFDATAFQRPHNQDARTAQVLWRGAALVSNRRKHGVMGGIDTTVSS